MRELLGNWRVGLPNICRLCRKPFDDGKWVTYLDATVLYGEWGRCHISCVEQFEQDMYG